MQGAAAVSLAILQGNFSHLGQNLKITIREIKDLVPYKNNARTHSDKQIRQIAQSITEYGWTNPILIDAQNNIISGHGRVAAAAILGLTEAPVIEISHLSEAKRRAYIIADNRLAELAGWDDDILALELAEIQVLDSSFNIELTGFNIPQIDVLIEKSKANKTAKEDEGIEALMPDGRPVSVVGDLWRAGQHMVLCGDALDPASYTKVLGNEKAQMVCIDAPYNVKIEGHVCGAGNVHHQEFVMASGEMSPVEFTDFLRRTTSNLIHFSIDGSIHFIFMDWRHMRELLAATESYAEMKNLCVWNKTNGGMGSLYRSKHELAFVFKNGAAPHINNVELGTHGRYRTNVWDYAGVNTFRENRMEELKMHPTVKPVEMIKDAILDCSNPRGIILDCFGGSGTTLIAAEMVRRRACLIELDPRYVDCTLRRFQKLTGEKAVHVATGKTFDELAALGEAEHAE